MIDNTKLDEFSYSIGGMAQCKEVQVFRIQCLILGFNTSVSLLIVKDRLTVASQNCSNIYLSYLSEKLDFLLKFSLS